MSNNKHYPPLITDRLRFFARAREEFLHPSPPGDADVVALLSKLCEAEQNASQACSKVAKMLPDEELATQVREDAGTHQARRGSLGELIEALGGSAPRKNECREILTRGADAVAHAGSALSAIDALEVMRQELKAAYDEALNSPLLDDTQRATLVRLAASSLRPQ